jgi:signal transduction histidine kinase
MSTLKLLSNSQDFRICTTALLYFLAAWLGLATSFDQGNLYPIWPGAGVGIALILIFGRKSWPGITMGAFISNTLIFSLKLKADVSIILIISVAISAINTLEVLVGRWMFQRFLPNGHMFNRSAEAFKFVLIAVSISLFSSITGTLILWINGYLSFDQIDFHFSTWYLGVLIGILVFTVFLLAITVPFEFQLNKKKIAESILFISLVVAILLLLDIQLILPILERSFPFLVIPFLLWMAFSFNTQIASTGILIASLVAIWFTISGRGPFVMESDNYSLLLLQVFITIIAITTLILTSTVRERREAQNTIQHFNETLETKIQERTRELNEEIESRRKAENEIRISNESLKKTNIELDSFVYSVSHDLRAPIASVKGLLNLIKKEKDVKTANQYFSMIEQRIDQQDIFIQEILDLSRNSRLDLEKDKVLFDKLVNEVFQQLQYFPHADQIEKELLVDQKEPFICDYKRLKVILNNLISNAIRYTNGKQPKITVSARVYQKKVNIAVKDNGAGIGKEHLDKVFNMFYRASDNNVGSGLGLYIVKETVDKLNGEVTLKSTKGKGTEVKLVLPTTENDT